MQGVPVDCWDNRFRTSEKRGTDLYAAGPKGERGSDTPAIGDATGSDHRYANGVHHLRDESHRANQSCAIAVGKGATMSARLEALGDDGVRTFRLQLSRLGNRGRRADHDDATLLNASHRVSGWQTKMKAHHRQYHVKQQLKSLLVKTRKWILGSGTVPRLNSS